MTTPAEPTDAELLERLRAADDATWDELRAAADAVAALETPARWAGGRTVDGVLQMPYPEYAPEVDRLIAALAAVSGGMPVFAWPDWPGTTRYRDPALVADAPVTDIPRLLTAIVRSERFSDGSIEGAVRSGLLAAMVERLQRWRTTRD